MTDSKNAAFEGWAILELMGHRRIGGYIREVQIAGAGMLRIDVPSDCSGISDRWCPTCGQCRCPNPEGSLDDVACPLHSPSSKHGEPLVTQFYPPSSLYGLTPCSEAAARVVAKSCQPKPISRWELPSPMINHEDDRSSEY